MKNKEKNGFSRLLLPEILTVLIGGAAVYGLGLLGKQLSVENALRDAVMAALGLAVSGFFLRREVVDSRLDYDNGEHLMRFWTAVWCSLLFSLTCAFLPAGGWPFLAVFVVLSLFSNLSVGIVFSGVFLMIATLWGQSVGIFSLISARLACGIGCGIISYMVNKTKRPYTTWVYGSKIYDNEIMAVR